MLRHDGPLRRVPCSIITYASVMAIIWSPSANWCCWTDWRCIPKWLIIMPVNDCGKVAPSRNTVTDFASLENMSSNARFQCIVCSGCGPDQVYIKWSKINVFLEQSIYVVWIVICHGPLDSYVTRYKVSSLCTCWVDIIELNMLVMNFQILATLHLQ